MVQYHVNEYRIQFNCKVQNKYEYLLIIEIQNVINAINRKTKISELIELK